MTTKEQQRQALETGWLLKNQKDLFELDLSNIYQMMTAYEKMT